MTDEDKLLIVAGTILLGVASRDPRTPPWVFQYRPIDHARRLLAERPKEFAEYMEDAAAVLAALEKQDD